jgi:hypothetical protein
MKKSLLSALLLIFCLNTFAQTPRLCLYEEFTGETCPPCASANPILNQLLASPTNSTKVVALKWQVPIPSAPSNTWSLYQTNKGEINSRSSLYGINSAPSGRMDGQNVTVYGATTDHPSGLNNTVISTAQSFTSPFSVTMARAWGTGCSAVNLTVNIQASANFTAVGNLVFRICMVERMINFSVQPGTNGEKDFEDVVIKSFPTLQGGTPMVKNWITGQTQSFTISCPVPSYVRKKSEIAMVGFIQDDGNKKVAQAVRADKQAVPADALAAVGASVNLTCGNIITPTITIKNTGPNAFSAATITPKNDGIATTPVNWVGNLAPGASTTIVLNNVNAASTSGSHIFSFDVDLNVPLFNLTANNNTATYIVAANYQGAPVAEGFVLNTFPPSNWGVLNTDGGSSTWARTTATGAYNKSQEAVKYDFYNNNNIGDVDELYLPPMNLNGSGNPILSFDLAYATRNVNSTDQLDFFASSDCGATWTNFYSKSGNNLQTVSNFYTNAFTPDAFDSTQWRTELVTLTGFNKPNVISKFVVTNSKGNNLYLDNINLSSGNVGLNKLSKNNLSFNLVPNPASNQVLIKLDANLSDDSKISINNALGQLIYVKNISNENNSIVVDTKEFSNGIYIVSIETAKHTSTQKLIIAK